MCSAVMEFSNSILPLTKNICRTCLVECQSIFMNIQDLVEHELAKVKLIDILVFLNCLENNDEENWPQGMCESCVSTALLAYNFKLDCLKANATLSQILTINSTPATLQRSADIHSIDINVVYQDHEYDVPLFNHPVLDFESNLPDKELAPLPPVSEITSAEQPLRKENEKKYSCTICPQSFTRIYGLRYHMAKHNGIKKHLCPKCGKSFHYSWGLRQHLQSHKEIGQFKCGFCNKNYKSRQSLKEHFRIAHSSNHHSFVCTLCGKSFTKKYTLLMHIKSHNGDKQFACSDCPKTYTRASYLKQHRLTHTWEGRPRPFSCVASNCERKFTTKHCLLVHIAHSHSSERPHKCDICQKCFATPSGLKVHKESHSIREVSCSVCHKQLANNRVLQKHMKTHEVNVDSTDMILETVVDSEFFDQVY